MKNIAVIGLGYVGLAMALVTANVKKRGKILYNVKGIEQNSTNGKKIVQSINSGKVPMEIKDKNFSILFKKALKQKNFITSVDYNILEKVDIVIVSINCDINKKTKQTDLKNFLNCIEKISLNIKNNCLIIVETTLPPGTTEEKIRPIIIKNFKKRGMNPDNILLSHSFERVTPGKNYIKSIKNMNRVFGSINKSSIKATSLFLKSIIDSKKYPLSQLNNPTESETCKIIENGYRALNIAYIEEWRQFSTKLNLDLDLILKSIRVRETHKNIMNPGLGVGGYCLTKDPIFGLSSSIQIYKKNKFKFPLSEKAVEINYRMSAQIMNELSSYYKNKFKFKSVLIFGASYKENVGDTRFSPTESVYNFFKKRNCKITVIDPLVKKWKEKKIDTNKKVSSKKFDIIIFAVKHDQFHKVKMNFKKKAIILDLNKVLSNSQRKAIENKYKDYFFLGAKRN